MAFQDFRDASRTKWGTDPEKGGGPISVEDIQLGCLLRIADAADQFNRQILSLLHDRDRQKARADELERQNRGLRIQVTKLKRKLERREDSNA